MPLILLSLIATLFSSPFGFATCTSRTEPGVYEMTGGGDYKYPLTKNVRSVVLTTTGKAMDNEIREAIRDYDVVIFDGDKGDFLVSKIITISDLKDKTVLGINNARLCTLWSVTPEIITALNEADVHSMNTRGGGGVLSNGANVREEAEYNTRRIILSMYGNEDYRSSGILAFARCENIIVRNLKFVGPGAIDVGGSDLLSIVRSTHMWVDHCDFMDGMDGNFDITQSSDFITVSWCTFSYTERSYMHQNTNLVGSNDREPEGFLNITFAYNIWDTGCKARMPMGRVGKIHMLNNYYCCTDNLTACINPRINSEFMIEGNYFDESLTRVFSASDNAKAYFWKPTNVIANADVAVPSSKGYVSLPYKDFTVLNAKALPSLLPQHAGATLYRHDPEANHVRGDANLDGSISVSDIVSVANYVLTGTY